MVIDTESIDNWHTLTLEELLDNYRDAKKSKSFAELLIAYYAVKGISSERVYLPELGLIAVVTILVKEPSVEGIVSAKIIMPEKDLYSGAKYLIRDYTYRTDNVPPEYKVHSCAYLSDYTVDSTMANIILSNYYEIHNNLIHYDVLRDYSRYIAYINDHAVHASVSLNATYSDIVSCVKSSSDGVAMSEDNTGLYYIGKIDSQEHLIFAKPYCTCIDCDCFLGISYFEVKEDLHRELIDANLLNIILDAVQVALMFHLDISVPNVTSFMPTGEYNELQSKLQDCSALYLGNGIIGLSKTLKNGLFTFIGIEIIFSKYSEGTTDLIFTATSDTNWQYDANIFDIIWKNLKLSVVLETFESEFRIHAIKLDTAYTLFNTSILVPDINDYLAQNRVKKWLTDRDIAVEFISDVILTLCVIPRYGIYAYHIDYYFRGNEVIECVCKREEVGVDNESYETYRYCCNVLDYISSSLVKYIRCRYVQD